jgi:hypothetical protein
MAEQADRIGELTTLRSRRVSFLGACYLLPVEAAGGQRSRVVCDDSIHRSDSSAPPVIPAQRCLLGNDSRRRRLLVDLSATARYKRSVSTTSVAIELDQPLVADPEVMRDLMEHDVPDLAA